MVDWHPYSAMGPLRYIRFKLGLWTRIKFPPEWVKQAEQEDLQTAASFIRESTYTGNSLKYRVRRERHRHSSGVDREWFVKKKKLI